MPKIEHGELDFVLNSLDAGSEHPSHPQFAWLVDQVAEEPLEILFKHRKRKELNSLERAAGDLLAMLYRVLLGKIEWNRQSIETALLRFLHERDSGIAENTRKTKRNAALRRGAQERAAALSEHQSWQQKADEEWIQNPTLSKSACATRIARGSENPDTIRRLIKKPM